MQCIFCKTESENSKSVEHVIPETLGSKIIVLPKGYVCDKCNNYFSIKVEKPILNHESIRNIRAWYQVPNKKGKMPSVSGVIAGEDIGILMKLNKKGKLEINPEKESQRNQLNKQLDKIGKGGDFSPFIFKLDINPPQKEMSKFLAKMALEFLTYRFLDDKSMVDFIVNSNHYDTIRNFARIGNTPKNWPYSIRRIFPIETQMEHPESGELVMFGLGYDVFLNHRKETYFVFLFYGVEFVINLGGPSIKGYEEWLNLNNNISPLIERNGASLMKEKNGSKLTYVIRGGNDLNKGKMFDRKQLEKYFA
uniref:HNH endonuclease n=1 Tax=Roseihalotalea indica TaxID=2867963 RepID=A0AA49Q096_9BACT|nr:HNH endonuclease [Tunicatimonas sp. TK19036]